MVAEGGARPHVAAIVLAAGLSTRMGSNKLLADFGGVPLIRATVENLPKASLDETVVVTGYQAGEIVTSLAGLDVRIVHNHDFAQGLSTSLRCGVQAVADRADAAMVCLADMPLVQGTVIDRMIAAFDPSNHRSVIVPVHLGRAGNPVLWGAGHFARLCQLSGDRGARHLIGGLSSEVLEIEAGTDAIFQDADAPDALERLRMQVRSAPKS